MPLELVPLGEPQKLRFSDKWFQDLGIIVSENEGEVQATVYGNSSAHARERALKFIKILKAGRVILDEDKEK